MGWERKEEQPRMQARISVLDRVVEGAWDEHRDLGDKVERIQSKTHPFWGRKTFLGSDGFQKKVCTGRLNRV